MQYKNNIFTVAKTSWGIVAYPLIQDKSKAALAPRAPRGAKCQLGNRSGHHNPTIRSRHLAR